MKEKYPPFTLYSLGAPQSVIMTQPEVVVKLLLGHSKSKLQDRSPEPPCVPSRKVPPERLVAESNSRLFPAIVISYKYSYNIVLIFKTVKWDSY